MQVTM